MQLQQNCVVTIMGAPGSGKGTQANILEQKFGFTRIETGGILREMRHENTERGRKVTEIIDAGLLAPPPIVADLVIEKTLQNLQEGKRVVFDGSPRTLYEAERLYEMFSENGIDHLLVIHVKVPKDETIARITNRLACNACKTVVAGTNGESEGDSCEKCEGTLVRRKDDTPEIMKQRWQQFEFRTEPVIQFFRNLGIVHGVNGDRSVEEIAQDIAAIIQDQIGTPTS